MDNKNKRSCRVRAAAKITLLSIGCLAFAAASANEAHAQESSPAQAAPASEPPPAPIAPAQEPSSTQSAPSSSPPDTPAQEQSSTTTLPQVTVEAPHSTPRSTSTVRTSQLSARPPIAPPPSAPDPNAAVQAAWPASGTQDARTGTVGVYANSTSVATKINTPLVNIPQSLSVVTREFISDNSFQNLTDITRYVPGVDVHQGEGNRDELIIRGVDSSANFFVTSAMTSNIFATSTMRRASRSSRDRVRSPSGAAPAAASSTAP
jgi:TonB-dependent receptor-like protein